MRSLLAQIYEQGVFHDNAITHKRGLVNAFKRYGEVLDFDYLANDRATMFAAFDQRIEQFNPDLIFTQFHSADILTVGEIQTLRQRYPHPQWTNWSGDSWAWSLTHPDVLAMCQELDLQLVCAPDALPIYADWGVNAKFWQIAYEPPVVDFPIMPSYDVVFLGNIISDPRRKLMEVLRALIGTRVGIYGDWQGANGHNTYHFAEGEALYKNAGIAIADCAYPDQTNYISNRPFQALAAGGALLLHQHVERMDVLSGLVAGKHYVEWHDLDHLPDLIYQWLLPDAEERRMKIVEAGQTFVLKHHTWDVRVKQLVEQWLPELERER